MRVPWVAVEGQFDVRVKHHVEYGHGTNLQGAKAQAIAGTKPGAAARPRNGVDAVRHRRDARRRTRRSGARAIPTLQLAIRSQASKEHQEAVWLEALELRLLNACSRARRALEADAAEKQGQQLGAPKLNSDVEVADRTADARPALPRSGLAGRSRHP